jgi:hypothetical protein
MPEGAACRFYDKAERDRQHALRRIQQRPTASITSWLIVPALLIGAMIASIAMWVS